MTAIRMTIAAARLGMIAGTLLALQPVRSDAQRAPEAIDAKLRADCRLAAQAIKTGRPDPKWDWAMGQISRCDESAGEALAAAWTSAPQDSATLAELVRTSRKVLDGRLYEALVAVASDPAAGWWPRSSALLALGSYVWPALVLSSDNLRAEPGASNPIGLVDHASQMIGSVPLPADSNARTRALLLRLAGEDPDTSIRSAARFIETRLTPRW